MILDRRYNELFSHLIFISEVALNERKRSSVPIFVQFPEALDERSAYVLLRLCTIARGETERESVYVQIHSRSCSRSPKFAILHLTVIKLGATAMGRRSEDRLREVGPAHTGLPRAREIYGNMNTPAEWNIDLNMYICI